MVASSFDRDLKSVLTPKEFGQDGGILWNGVTIEDAIFDDEDREVSTGEGVIHIMPVPMIIGRTSDFVGIAGGQLVTVGTKEYTVSNWQTDGSGMIEIMLNFVRNAP